MTHKVITLEFVVPTLLAIALGVTLSVGAVYLIDNYLGPIEQAEAHYLKPRGAWTNDRTRAFRFSTMDAGRR
jgi:hypothetical protein